MFHGYLNYGFVAENNQPEPKIFKIRSKYINYYMNMSEYNFGFGDVLAID